MVTLVLTGRGPKAVTEICRGWMVEKWLAAASAEHAQRVTADVDVTAPEPLLKNRACLGVVACAAELALLAWRRWAWWCRQVPDWERAGLAEQVEGPLSVG
jgi:hypothetical protein